VKWIQQRSHHPGQRSEPTVFKRDATREIPRYRRFPIRSATPVGANRCAVATRVVIVDARTPRRPTRTEECQPTHTGHEEGVASRVCWVTLCSWLPASSRKQCQ
jgi:hypothetical protein